MVGVENSEEFNESLPTTDSIIRGAKMFFTLNSCPSYLIRLYWKAIYGEKSTLVLLASNILKKSNKYFKKKALRIFARVTKMLRFQYISFLDNDEKNIKLREDIYNVKGKTQTHTDH